MKITLKLLLIVLGLVFLLLAALKVPGRFVDFGWLGAFCLALAFFIVV